MRPPQSPQDISGLPASHPTTRMGFLVKCGSFDDTRTRSVSGGNRSRNLGFTCDPKADPYATTPSTQSTTHHLSILLQNIKHKNMNIV